VPFVLVPAYDDETVRWVYLDGDPRRAEDSRLPAGRTTLVPSYRFRLREQTL
jgi:hypothetical protein